jgi:hypothetical protein
MRKPFCVDLANAFMWLTVLATAFILFWNSDKLWMMVVAILVGGWTSIGLFANHRRTGD